MELSSFLLWGISFRFRKKYHKFHSFPKFTAKYSLGKLTKGVFFSPVQCQNFWNYFAVLVYVSLVLSNPRRTGVNTLQSGKKLHLLSAPAIYTMVDTRIRNMYLMKMLSLKGVSGLPSYPIPLFFLNI